jgi:hypothetical protein
MKGLELTADMDLIIENGDFKIAEDVTQQNVRLLIYFEKGELKHAPLTGVGRSKFINGTLDGKLKKEIVNQLQSDGIEPKSINYSEGKINIEL